MAFLVTPQVLAANGAPIFFVDNVRYADPAIVLGLVLLPLMPALTSQTWRWTLLAGFAGIVIATQLDETIWPINVLSKHFVAPITGWDSRLGLVLGIVVLAVGLVLVGRRRPWSWHPSRWMAIVAVAGIVVGGFGLQQSYLSHRYTASNLAPPFNWAQSISGSRIGVAGTFTQLQYALYGRALSNYVQYIGVQGAHGSYAPAADCSQWREQVNDGHYRYVVTSTGLVSRRADVFTTPFSYTVWTGR